MGMKMKRKQLWKPLLGLAMMGTAVVVLAVQSFAEQDTIPAITWVTTASEESAESEPQTEPLETEADSVTANRQPVFDWDKPAISISGFPEDKSAALSAFQPVPR